MKSEKWKKNLFLRMTMGEKVLFYSQDEIMQQSMKKVKDLKDFVQMQVHLFGILGYFNPSWWQNFPLWFHHVVKSMGRDEWNSIIMAVSLKLIHWQQESNAQDKSSSSLKLMLLAETKEISSDPVFFKRLMLFFSWKNHWFFCFFFQSNEDQNEKTCT